jgi:dolichyl-phosphate-mannose-protein mannosyltransferase
MSRKPKKKRKTVNATQTGHSRYKNPGMKEVTTPTLPHAPQKISRGLFETLQHPLFIVLSVGFILRVMPIMWGIPINLFIHSYHPDEGKVLLSILDFPEIYWTSKAFMGYGTAIQYILGALLFPLKLFLVKSSNHSYEYYIIVSVFSRLISVILSTICIYLTYAIAKKIYDKKVAFLSASFLAVSFYHTLNSPLITLDVSSSFLLMLNFLLCYRAIEKNRLMDYIFLGLASGLLVGTKTVLGIFFCIPFLLSFLNLIYPQNSFNADQPKFLQQSKLLITYVFVAAVVFILFNPQIFLDINKYIAFYLKEKHDWVDRTRGTIEQIIPIWGGNTIKSVGTCIPVLALIGIIFPGKKELRLKIMLIIFVILYYGFWRWFLSPRYVIVITPILCIFAANACILIFHQKSMALRRISILIIIISIGYSLYWCGSGIYLRLNDTRTSAAKFIAQKITKGTTIGYSGVSERYTWKTHSWRYPKIDPNQFRIIDFLSKPEVLVINFDDANAILKTLKSDKLLSNYILPEIYHKDWYRYSAPSPKIFKFYDELLLNKKSNYILLKTFNRKFNVPLEFAPPEIKIFTKKS